MFALQNGGWCASSSTAFRTFAKYGRSKKCRRGKGGPWANDVYYLKGEFHRLSLFYNLNAEDTRWRANFEIKFSRYLDDIRHETICNISSLSNVQITNKSKDN